MNTSQDIEKLIDMMARLPGLGPRSARRAVLHLVRKRTAQMGPLATLMGQVAASVKECSTCGTICTNEICEICTDPKRGNGQLCVVEDVGDLWAMERSGAYKGRYHVLGGTLSALDDIGPEELRIPDLVRRVTAGDISEVILALNATIDGQTTAHYIADQIQDQVQITSLGRGVPLGGELDYLDDGTISAALSTRRAM